MTTESYIGISRFVKRQTPASPFAHYEGSWQEVVGHIQNNWSKASVAQRGKHGEPRVLLVPLPTQGFYTSTREVTEKDTLHAYLFRRQAQEEPFIKVSLPGCKQAAKFVKAVLYHKTALEEEPGYYSEYEWELVSINASLFSHEPMHPLTMARNYLGKTGGTYAHYTMEEVMESIWFWKDKAPVDPELPDERKG